MKDLVRTLLATYAETVQALRRERARLKGQIAEIDAAIGPETKPYVGTRDAIRRVLLETPGLRICEIAAKVPLYSGKDVNRAVGSMVADNILRTEGERVNPGYRYFVIDGREKPYGYAKAAMS